MIIFVLILFAVTCIGISVSKKNQFFEDYSSPKNTGAINAVFSVLIFLNHSVGYLDLNGVLDAPYFILFRFLGQFVVATYLFYSGFGIMESYKKKGHNYIKAMPVNRLFKTWYHFAIVVAIYAVISIGIRGIKYKPTHILLAFTGLTALGNSNWYMFVTFVLYILLIVSFFIFKKSKVSAMVLFTVLVVGFSLIEYGAGLGTRWYNTIFCFPAGMFFSLFKPKIDKFFMMNDASWAIGFSICLAGFIIFSSTRYVSIANYNLFAVFGAVTITVLMMKIKIGNSVLSWFSKHIFSFFILQRIPMLLMKHFGFAKNGYIFIIVCFFFTILLAVLFDMLTDKLDALVFKKRKKIKKQSEITV